VKSKNQPSLPTGRAFVVQLHAEADIAKGRTKGRVEHMVSFQATHFDSLGALVTFMARAIAEHEAEKDHSEDCLLDEEDNPGYALQPTARPPVHKDG
jgi:hypothetical protein